MCAMAVLPRWTENEAYWLDDFTISNADLDYLFNIFLETETPLSLRDLTLKLIEYRLEQEGRYIQQQIERGLLFQPKLDYGVGQKIVFPTRQYDVGEIIAKRPGNNPEHGEFAVITVRFENGKTVEFASSLLTDHLMNLSDDLSTDETTNPLHVLRRYGRDIAQKLKDRFDVETDVVYLAGRWFLKSLLADVNIAHLHLAEAVLDMHGGGPLDTAAILKEIGAEFDVNQRLQIFSMDYALQSDTRFDEVGPAGQVLWYLRNMEPEIVKTVPMQLHYDPINYDVRILTPEMRDVVLEIDDELSPIDLPEGEEDSVTVVLTYPYRRTGTLPLTAHLQGLFPTAFETNRIMTTLVDVQTQETVPGWVVRDQGYVYGLEPLYRKYQIPIGGYVTVRHHEDPAKLIIDFSNHRPRTEWIRLATVEDDFLRFQNHKRSIGAAYDDLMVFGVDNLASLDKLWERCRRWSISDVVAKLMPELARLVPQQTVHFKTLYSAVNLVKRCPPEPILHALASHYAYVGGSYWR